MRHGKIWAGAVLGAGLLMAGNAQASAFRLADAVNAPDWLSLSGSYRLRYETLDGRFRAGKTGSDQILVSRLLLGAEARLGEGFYAGAELEDSRAWLADSGTALSTASVDAFEPLRFYLGWKGASVFESGDRFDIQGGRITIDAGSRRLVARNHYRNTLNAFTGIDAHWTAADGTTVQAFYTLPVNREPTAFSSLEDNAVRLDSESWHTRFWGVIADVPHLAGRATGEFYVYGLHDEDRPGTAVADRDLYTPGVRFFAKPRRGLVDFEVEAAMQFGTSRLSKSATKDLDHLAGFIHGDVGYTFTAPWSPRLELAYDYASGDDNPGDGTDNRFDTLYGARRFDFGPTGIYGAFARSNISSPGVKLEVKPQKRLDAFLFYRAVWLASARDAWTTASLQDASGASGSFLGNQIEARLRYDLVPGSIKLEAGGAVLFKGSYEDQVPGAPTDGDSTYAYMQASVSF